MDLKCNAQTNLFFFLEDGICRVRIVPLKQNTEDFEWDIADLNLCRIDVGY